MPTIAIVFLLCLMSSPLWADAFSYKAAVVRVYDGDTVTVRIDGWPEPVNPVSVRLFGIDTPELPPRALCAAEGRMALQARLFALELLPIGSKITVHFDRRRKDRYGRLLARVKSPYGVNVSDALLSARLAQPYKGNTRVNWCHLGTGTRPLLLLPENPGASGRPDGTASGARSRP